MTSAVWRLLDDLGIIPGWRNGKLPGVATNIVISGELTSDCIRGSDYWSIHFRKQIEELRKRGVRIWPDILVQCGPVVVVVEIKQRYRSGAFMLPWLQHERYDAFSSWMERAGFTVNTHYALCRHTFAQGAAAEDPKKFGYSVETLLQECAQQVGIISLIPLKCVGHLAEMAHRHGSPIVLPPARTVRTDITEDLAYRGPCYQLPASLLNAVLLMLANGHCLSTPAALRLLNEGYRVSDVQAILTGAHAQTHLGAWELPKPRIAATGELNLFETEHRHRSSSRSIPLKGIAITSTESDAPFLPTHSPVAFIHHCGEGFARKIAEVNSVRATLAQHRPPRHTQPLIDFYYDDPF